MLAEKIGTLPDATKESTPSHVLQLIFRETGRGKRDRRLGLFDITIVRVHKFLTTVTDLNPVALRFGWSKSEVGGYG